MSRRSIIVHFHFFKNAGTSVESILHGHFKQRFMTHEPGGAAETFPAAALVPVLEQHENIQAISSHTISFPLPARSGWSVFPIVFLRHPLDRILSMYNFEKEQDSQSPGAKLAKALGPAGYIEGRLRSPGERTLRNYQAWMLTRGQVEPANDEVLLEAAAMVLDDLPVVGVVDEFDASIRRFSAWLAPHFPGLVMSPEHQNRSGLASLSMDERLSRLRNAIGAELFRRIEHENAVDLELYRRARRRLV